MGKIKDLLKVNTNLIRTRSFDFRGVNFKVIVPLASEADEMSAVIANPPEEELNARYEEFTKDLLSKKAEIEDPDFENKTGFKIEFLENDIMFNGFSMREKARNEVSFELRVIEAFKFLVGPSGEQLGRLPYAEIEEDFSRPIQIDMVKKIAEVISPGYEELRKN